MCIELDRRSLLTDDTVLLPLVHDLPDVGWPISFCSALPTFHPPKDIPGDFSRVEGTPRREPPLLVAAHRPPTHRGAVTKTPW